MDTKTWRDYVLSDVGILIMLAAARLLFHILTNGQYGFHRDELATVDEARHLAWGYVAYPPLTPLIARAALELFGNSLVGLRFFSALVQCIAMVLVGLMAKELGGGRRAQVLAALAAFAAPISMAMGAMYQYVSFDYLWWVLIAYLMIRLLKTEDARLWLAIGAAIGFGAQTKYTISVIVLGIIVGVLLTRARRWLASPWLWGGVLLSLLIFLPNLIYQINHGFISLRFLAFLHERDVSIGRADSFLFDQLYLSANPVTIPLWICGIYFYFFEKENRHFRPLGWIFVTTFLFFFLARGRGYYTGAAYPILFAGGAVFIERWLAAKSGLAARRVWTTAWIALSVGIILVVPICAPILPINSPGWKIVSEINSEFKEQIGWPDLVETVSKIYHDLPAEDKERAGIIAGNYGEAGAIELYGPAYGLPMPISGINSFWERGYGDPPPQVLVVVGFNSYHTGLLFKRCDLAGHVTNRDNIVNEETREHPDIFICRDMIYPWHVIWKEMQYFG
jgi:hypothetical protein